MSENRTAKRSVVPALAQVATGLALGLVVLPALLGDDAHRGPRFDGAVPPEQLGWLAGALLVAFWLVAVAPALARALAGLLSSPAELADSRPRSRSPVNTHAARDVARLLVAAAYVAVVQAILRRPLLAVLEPTVEPAAAEAVFAACALVLLLLLLVWLHGAARPLVDRVAWHALDALVATSGAGTASPDGTTLAGSTRATRTAAAAATVLAPGAYESDATLAAQPAPAAAGEATRPAVPVDADVTLGAETVSAEQAAARPEPRADG